METLAKNLTVNSNHASVSSSFAESALQLTAFTKDLKVMFLAYCRSSEFIKREKESCVVTV